MIKLKSIFRWIRAWVWCAIYGFPSIKMIVIGVTGTDGKTTTTNIIFEILKRAGLRAGMISTVYAKVGDKTLDTGLHTTVPDSGELQKIIWQMKKEGVTHLVLETTSHALDQHRVAGIRYDIGVWTNISREHLDYHKTMERYVGAKLLMFDTVKWAVLNKDDEYFGKFLEYCKERKAEILEYTKTDIKKISDALGGDYNKYNIAACEKVAEILKIDRKIVLETIEKFEGVDGRRQEIRVGQNFEVIVDFAHTPNALEQLLKSFEGKRRIVVFGATGGRDPGKRPYMGKVAVKNAEEVIVTSDDTRDESQDDIYRQIVSEIDKKGMKKVIKENDRKQAIIKAVSMAKKGDVVILAGKGHEKTILHGKIEHSWSDVEEAKKAIILVSDEKKT